jgi:inorganic triphosphatase YgiF
MDTATPAAAMEIEAKLLVPNAASARAIARLPQIGEFRLQARSEARLHSVYVDTEDFSLAKSGVALRLRRQSGRWEATAKYTGVVSKGVHERQELNVPLANAPRMPFQLPEGPLETSLKAIVCARPLSPILITEVRRRLSDVFALDAEDGAEPLAELAVDSVRARGPGKDTPTESYSEVEIELRRGQRTDLEALAQLLYQAYELAPSPGSKFSRGMLLVHGERSSALLADRVVQPTDTVTDAVRKFVARHLLALRMNDPGTRTGEDPEFLHDMRVATRRLRGISHDFEEAFPVRLLATLRKDLKWLGHLLGRVRDLDVQLAGLDRFIAVDLPDARDDLAPYHRSLQEQRRLQRAAMLAGLDSARYFRLLIRLEHYAHPALRRPASRNPTGRLGVLQSGRAALQVAYRRLRKCGNRLPTVPAPEDLHALRILAKRLRYLLGFLSELTGKPGRRFTRRLVRLQDRLGEYQDAMVAAELVRGYCGRLGPQAELTEVLALGALMGGNLQRAREIRMAVHAAWERFERKRSRRDFREVLRRLDGVGRRKARDRGPEVAAAKP